MDNLFLVIDGSALMCSAYYATLPYEVKCARTEEEKEQFYHLIEHNQRGVYTNGIGGFLNVLHSVIKTAAPSHLVVCFDKSRLDTFRKDIYPEYKAQRTPKPEPLVKQMENIKTFLKAVGIPVLEHERFEADDFAGSVCKSFESANMPVRFVTKDLDYFQLVNEFTKGWIMVSEDQRNSLSEKYGEQENIPRGFYEYDVAVVKGECGVYPYQIADWKGISGDISDNIPGIRGVADKTAVPLLQHYGTLESILCAVHNATEKGFLSDLKGFWKDNLKITRPPIEQLRNGANMGILCKELATIKTDLDVGKPEDYELCIDYEKFTNLCNKLELFDLSDSIEEWLQWESIDEELDME